MKKLFEKKYHDLISQINSYIPNGNKSLVKKAFWFGFDAHRNQFRRSGDPFFEHCVRAASILADLKMDVTTIAAGLLHDVVEDTGITLAVTREEFGDDIANLVDGVTKISDLKFQKAEIQQAENFRKMVLSMAKDIRVVMIKFSDRLHNMQTLEYLPKKKQKSIAQETLDVYAPLAHRFGIARLGWQLEDLALKFIDPPAYKYLDRKITEKWDDRQKHIEMMKQPVIDAMNKLAIPVTIIGRPKSFYSIYRKMHEQKIPFDEVYDLLAMRIITEKNEDCYAVMGALHALYTPVEGGFKDYIATPKSNGYQSLHTKVISPTGRMMEVQIRTKSMDYTAELGIAAHWVYKERQSDKQLNEQLVWLRQQLDWSKDNPDPGEFMKSFKFDLFHDEIFVFTPKGRLVNLPRNATPVDFAFSVHTEIGLHCIGAKVNSKVVPLYTALESGDEIEVLTSSKPGIQEYWTSFVVTSKARNQIRKWLRENKRFQFEKLGREILEHELEKYNIKPDAINETFLKNRSGYGNLSMLWQALGTHQVPPETIAGRLFPEEVERRKSSLFGRIPGILKKSPRNGTREPYIIIHGDSPLVIELSACCTPIPGDKIVGYSSPERGVIVHRVKCKGVPKDLSKRERWVTVEWAPVSNREFPATIQIIETDRKHMLRDMALAISKLDINILSIHVETKDILGIADITMEVKNVDQLKKVTNALMKVKGIQRIKR